MSENRADSYLLDDDETVWPNPDDPDGIQWRLRYGHATRSDVLVAASFLSAYRELVEMPRRQRDKRVSRIRALAEAQHGERRRRSA